MREYTIIFKDGLKKGLRNSKDNPKNIGALTLANGVFQEAGKLINIDELENFDISTIPACTFPFPQCFQLRNWCLICTPVNIYTYIDGVLTLIYTAVEGSTWTVADFYDFLVLTNGAEFLTLDPETGAWCEYDEAEISKCLCVCDVNGQLFVGGPDVSIGAGFLGD